MRNLSNKKYVIPTLLFTLFMVVGFIMTKWLNSANQELTYGSDGPVEAPVITPIHKPDSEVIPPPDTNHTDPIDEPTPPTPPTPNPDDLPKYTTHSLTRIINDLSRQDYPRDVTIIYTNLENDIPQKSIANVRSYIRSGIWQSVKVIDFSPKTGDKLKTITLEIKRPDVVETVNPAEESQDEE